MTVLLMLTHPVCSKKLLLKKLTNTKFDNEKIKIHGNLY
jgi:hypothetical protein